MSRELLIVGEAEIESMDLKTLREQIVHLIGNRSRRDEYWERMQEKLKALNNELA